MPSPSGSAVALTPASHRWALLCAGLVVMLGASLLACWFSGVPELAAFASWRGKTNTCIANVCLGASMILLLRARTSGQGWLSVALAWLALGIGAATLLQYLSGTSLGIDELVLPDVPTSENPTLPNRMSPSAALGFVLVGTAILFRHARAQRLNKLGQIVALVALTLNGIALIGYLYSATLLYQPTRFIRVSPYTAFAQAALCVSLLLSQLDLGVTRSAAGVGLGGYLTRRLLPPAIAVPVIVGWLMLDITQHGSLSASDAHALHAMAVVAALLSLVLFLGKSVSTLEHKRDRALELLEHSGRLTSGLARARSVDEVLEVTMDLGLTALDAAAFGLLLLSADKRTLKTQATRGYPIAATAGFDLIEMTSELPVTEAARERKPVFVASLAELSARYPTFDRATPHGAWAALPLEGSSGVLGVLAISFPTGRAFDRETRERLRQLAWQCAQALDRALLFDSEQRARRAAEAASRAKDDFLALLGHELRNPLSPILTSLQVMKLRAPDALAKERAVMERQVHHMRHLIDDLLDVSRITSGRISLRKRRHELHALVAAALEVSSPLIEQRKHRVVSDVPPGLWVEVDSARMVQVLSNLLTNAAKYTDPGGEIAIEGRSSGGTVLLRVSDTGIGIPAELLPKVFELFVQGKRSLDRSQGGLGLGLALVKSLVELHDGRVFAESAGPGLGTSISLELPATLAEELAAADTPAPASADVEPQRVLVVDDNRDAADSAAEAIMLSGHRVRVAYDGPSALEAAREFEPTIVFLDIGLPVMDGYEVARRLLATPGGLRPTLVAVTGYGQEEDRKRSSEAGFDRHLVKPVSMEEALALVSHYGRLHKAKTVAENLLAASGD